MEPRHAPMLGNSRQVFFILIKMTYMRVLIGSPTDALNHIMKIILDGKKTHFVTAIAYTGSCSSASSISVIDPAGGVIRTLEEAGTARNETVYGDYIATARRS